MVPIGIGGSAGRHHRQTAPIRLLRLLPVAIAVSLLSACSTGATTTATSVMTAGGGGAGGDGGGSGLPVTSSPTTSPTTLPATTSPPTTAPPTTDVQAPYFGPYGVLKTMNMGGEILSGAVCDVRSPFQVGFETPTISWSMAFVPDAAQQGGSGTLSYAYSFPSLGESHDATGTYTMSVPDPTGVRHVALSSSDHVVFNGFDGNIPMSYKFDLVPATAC